MPRPTHCSIRIACFVVTLAAGPLATDNRQVRAATLTFGHTCDEIWQTCCPCGGDMNCINWNRPPVMFPLCPSLPGASDTAIVPVDCTVAGPPIIQASAQVLQQTGGTLTLLGVLAIETATFDSDVDWLAYGITRTPTTGATAIANAGLTLSGSAAKGLGALGTLHGDITLTANCPTLWTGDGPLTIGAAPGGAPAVFRNNPGRTFDVQTNAAILRLSFGLGAIDNDGSIVKSIASGQSDWNTYLDNSGLLDIQSGSIRLSGDGANSGEFRVPSGSSLRIATTAMDFNAGASITGDGDTFVEDTGTGSALVINSACDIDRISLLPSAQITGAAEIRLLELMTLTGAQDYAPTRILPGALALADGGLTSETGNFTVEGTLRVANAAIGPRDAALTIASSGILDLQDAATVTTFSFSPPAIQNNGTVQKLTGPGSATITSAFNGPFNHNAGALAHVAAGTLILNTTVNSASAWQSDAGATLEFSYNATMNPGSSFSGDGIFHIRNGTFRIASGVALTARQLLFGSSTQSPFVEDVSNSIGSLTVTDHMSWTQGSLDQNQQLVLNIPAASILDFNHTSTAVTGATDLQLAGTANVNVTTPITISPAGVWNIAPTGRFDIKVDGAVSATNSTINNSGTFIKSAGAGIATISFTRFFNSGIVRCTSGELRFVGGGAPYNQTAGATELAGGNIFNSHVMTLSGGRLTGAGTLTASPNNTGATVQPGNSAGLLTIAASPSPFVAGNYTQGAGGTLDIELGGLIPGTQHDRLAVAAAASLAGKLRVTRINGFTPSLGQTFTILTAASRTGTFSSLSVTNFPNGLTVQPSYTPTTVVLTVVPGPSTLGDMNCDGRIDGEDIAAFVLAVLDPTAFDDEYDCEILHGDANASGLTDINDALPFADIIVDQ